MEVKKIKVSSCEMFILKTPVQLHLLETFFSIFSRSTLRHHFVTKTGNSFPCAEEIFSKRQLERLLYLSLVCCDILVTFYTVVINSVETLS